jgi:hypothetical protein
MGAAGICARSPLRGSLEAGGLGGWLILVGAARRLSACRAPLQLGLAGAGWWWEVAGALPMAALVGIWIAGAAALDSERTASCRRRAASVGAARRLLGCVGNEVAMDGGGGADAAPTVFWRKF